MSPKMTIEPAFALNSIRADGDNFTTYAFELGVPWHFNELRRGPYVRPFIGIVGFSGSELDGINQFFAGAGLGAKIPIMDRLAWRVEANYAQVFDDGDVEGGGQIGLRVELSFFTR